MEDRILINLKGNGEIEATNYVLLMDGENNSKGFFVYLPEALSSKWIYIEFDKPNGDKVSSNRLIPSKAENGFFVEYELTNGVLDFSGVVGVQIVARDENGSVWKSVTKKFTVNYSINAVEQVIENEGELIANMQAQIDGKQTKLVAGRNIVLEEEGDQVRIYVPTTSIGVSADEVQEQIDQSLVSVNQDIQGSIETANSAKEIAQGAIDIANAYKGLIDEANGVATGANENSNKAIESANEANATANSATVTAEEAKDIANNAKQIAEGIDDVASNALYLAGQVNGLAAEAKTIAGNAKTEVDNFKTEVNGKFDEANNTHSDLYSKFEVVSSDVATISSNLGDLSNNLQKNYQVKLSFDGTYDDTKNKVATVQTVLDKIAELGEESPDSIAGINNRIQANAEDIQSTIGMVNNLSDILSAELSRIEENYAQKSEVVDKTSNQTITGAKKFLSEIGLDENGSYLSNTQLALDAYRTVYGTANIKYGGMFLSFPTAVDGSDQGSETLATREWTESKLGDFDFSEFDIARL